MADPAVQRGLQILAKPRDEKPMSAEEREILFGKSQYKQRLKTWRRTGFSIRPAV
jgi:hypothetical protein